MSVVRRPVNPTVLIPIKDFRRAKARLAPRLDASARGDLARTMAEQVVRAAGSLPVAVVCNDDEVAEWAQTVGAAVLWVDLEGLNPSVTEAVSRISHAPDSAGDHVLICHADLPLADSLGELAQRDTVTIVPDRHLDGTNVLSLPTGRGFRFRYGPGSLRAHIEEALACGLDVSIRRVPALEWDVDTPGDLDDLDAPAAQAVKDAERA